MVSGASARMRLVDFQLGSSGKNWRNFCVPAGGFREPKSADTGRVTLDASGNERTPEDIHMNGFGVWSFINSTVPGHLAALLARNGLRLEDIDLFVFHQASALTLDSLERTLRIPEGKSFRHLETVGNTVSASIPMTLARAEEEGRLRPGMWVLLSGFGVGLSVGSVLVKV